VCGCDIAPFCQCAYDTRDVCCPSYPRCSCRRRRRSRYQQQQQACNQLQDYPGQNPYTGRRLSQRAQQDFLQACDDQDYRYIRQRFAL
jgi:hypothetical protein